MTLQEYIKGTGMDFLNYPWLLILLGIGEWLLFRRYVRALPKRELSRCRQLAADGILAVISILLQFVHLQVAWLNIFFLTAWSFYLLLISVYDWKESLLTSSIYCLALEGAKLLGRDGFLILLLSHILPEPPELVLHLILGGSYLLLLLLVIWWVSRKSLHLEYLNISAGQLWGLVFPLILYLGVRQLEFSYIDLLDEQLWSLMVLLQLSIAVCGVIVITTTSQLLSVELERNELLKKQMLFEKRQQQYLLQEQTIQSVNRKYHDLKHYIAGMEALQGKEKYDFIRTLKEEIEPYERIQKTGNELLDILLFERIEECQKKGIRLVPYIDGRRMDFLNTMDLCAIFGNAMDNAIEATEKVPYVNMKEISLKIGVSDQLLIMRFQNYFEGTVKMQNEKILSTKAETSEHGYGLENIQAIVNKYDGNMACEVHEQEFALHILIPLPQNTDCAAESE